MQPKSKSMAKTAELLAWLYTHILQKLTNSLVNYKQKLKNLK